MEHLVSPNLSFLLSFFLSSFIPFLHSFTPSVTLCFFLIICLVFLYYCIFTVFIPFISLISPILILYITLDIDFNSSHLFLTTPYHAMPYYVVLCRVMTCLPLCLALHPLLYYFPYSCRIFN